MYSHVTYSCTQNVIGRCTCIQIYVQPVYMSQTLQAMHIDFCLFLCPLALVCQNIRARNKEFTRSTLTLLTTGVAEALNQKFDINTLHILHSCILAGYRHAAASAWTQEHATGLMRVRNICVSKPQTTALHERPILREQCFDIIKSYQSSRNEAIVKQKSTIYNHNRE